MTAAATIATVATNAGDYGALSARQSRDYGVNDQKIDGRKTSDQKLADLEIVKRARDGDHEAFRILVKRHESRVYALALRLLGDPEWAQDAVQEAFIKAYRGLRKFEGRALFSTWMYRLTYNHCLDMRRADKSGRYVEWDEERTTGDDVGDPSVPSLASSIRGPGEEIERGELREQLQKAIETLPEPIRQTLLMREVDGLPYSEIADLQKIPKGTVMSRLFHARKRLREVLLEQGVSPHGQTANLGPEETPQ
jgi:RNA polymerase sigma-70 factor (ECF subfamily)